MSPLNLYQDSNITFGFFLNAEDATPACLTNSRIRAGENGGAAAQRRRRRRLPAIEELEEIKINVVDGNSEAVDSC